MPRRLSSREIETVLLDAGFVLSRRKGSHCIYTRLGYSGHVTVVAGEKVVPMGTLASIIRQSGLSRKDFGI